MKRKTGKFLSLLLSLALLCGLCMPSASAAESRYSDTRGHWAEAAIERWSGYGVIQGYGDTFRPDASITRAQMAKILSNTLGLTETDGNPFSDVAEDAWYAPYVLRCHAAGILAGDNGKANPDAVITRQQAMVMLGRALGIAPEKRPDLSAFVDGSEVGTWAAPYVAAMVDSGIVGGVGNGRLAPGGTMTRAALVTVLDRAVVQYIQAPGSYELENEDGIILVAAGKVTLSGKTSADILVTPAADGKTLTFDKATVKGNITVQAGDAKITVKDSKLPDITLTGEGSKVTESKPTTGSTSSGGSHGGGGSSTPAYSNLTIAESKAVSSGTYQNVTITAAVGDGDVTLSGLTVRENLYIYGGGSNSVKLENCTILGKIIMAKSGGQPPRLHLTNTSVTRVETQKPAIIEAADAASAVTAVEAKADVEIRGAQTTVAAVTVPAAAAAPVAVAVTAGTVSKVEAKGETVVSGAADAVGSVVAESVVTVDSAAVAKVEVPASAENVTVNVQGNSAITVEINSDSTTIAAESDANITVSGTAKDNVTTHTHSWGDGEVTKQPTCMEEGVKTYTCTDAACPVGTKTEAIAKAEHTPVTDEAVAADCLTPGKTAGSHCSVCGTVLQAQETVPALGHDYSQEWTNGGPGGHYHKCVRCSDITDQAEHTYDITDCTQAAVCTVCGNQKAAGEHAWGQGTEVKAATCTEAGAKTYTCTLCSMTKTEDIQALGHDYAAEFTVDKAATCTETGSKSRHCSRCDAATDITEIPMTEHRYQETVTKEATCTEAGERTNTCSVCGKSWTNQIDPLGHDYAAEFTVDKAATCTEAGSKSRHCSRCDAMTDVTEIPMTEHHYQKTVTKEATCTEAGERLLTCSVCGKSLTDEIEPLGHDFSADFTVDKAATCTEAGSKSKHCSRCDAVTEETVIPAAGHAWGGWVNFDADSHKHTCSVCQAEETAAHTWDSGVITTEPTETETGVKTYTCSDCQATKTESLPVVSPAEAWIRATAAGVYLDWTPKEGYTGFYYVNGTICGRNPSQYLTRDLTKYTEEAALSYKIEVVTDSGSRETWIQTGNMVSVEIDDSTPAVSVVGQEDGSYLFESTDGFTGTYAYTLRAPDDTAIYTYSVGAGQTTAYGAPYEGCTFDVRKVSWPTGQKLSAITVTISGITNVTPSFYDFSGTYVEVTDEAELRSALNAGGLVKVMNDIDVTDTSVHGGGAVTLDLNSHTLQLGTNMLNFTNGKTASIIDSSAEQTGKILGAHINVSGSSSLTCTGGTYSKITSSGGRNLTLTNVTVDDLGINGMQTVQIAGCTLGGGQSVGFTSCAEVTIHGTNIQNTPLNITDCPSVEFDSVTYGDNDNMWNKIAITKKSCVVFHDVTVMAGTGGITVTDSGTTLTVNSGTYTHNGYELQELFYETVSNPGEVIITGGTFNRDPSAYVDLTTHTVTTETTESGTTYTVTANS